jgi:hypothetical protein
VIAIRVLIAAALIGTPLLVASQRRRTRSAARSRMRSTAHRGLVRRPQARQPSSSTFIIDVRGDVPGDDAQLLKIVPGTCGMLVGGTSADYVASDISTHLGIARTPPIQGCLKLFAPHSQQARWQVASLSATV